MFSKKLKIQISSLGFIFVFFFSACTNIQNQEINYNIITPKSEWIYYSDSLITLSTNLNSDEILWYSDKAGFLGNGNGFTVKLKPGVHNIKAVFRDNQKSVLIYVEERSISHGQTFMYLVNSNQQALSIPNGVYKPGLVALDGSVSKFSINEKSIERELKRDFHIDCNAKGRKILSNSSRTANKNVYSLNDEKKFYVINTKYQSLEPHEILAKVIHVSESYVVWYPKNPEEYSDIRVNENSLDLCINEIENRIIPRLKSLWGELPDIDNDGKISLLFTPTINEEETAIGFFNPEDFYARDIESPFSNEMDVLYIAVPEAEKFSYSVNCISATIAHELTHAINYNIKTYSRVLKKITNPPVEETFLDEAMSHLSESLCGYGISGGNISNLSYYLNNLEKYSVCKADFMGNEDTNGRRAAATMFLSWLFWKKGGITWNSEDPLEIIDRGGIAFLQRLVASEGTGWEHIGNIFGLKTDILYVNMVEELNDKRSDIESMLLDPYSGEPVQLFPDNREYCFIETGKKWNLKLPELKKDTDVSLIPYSFVIFEKCNNQNELIITNTDIKGQVIGLICME